MTAEWKAELVAAVPAEQRESLSRRIDRAVAEGWTSLGLWTGDGPDDEGDLYGVPPGGPSGFVPMAWGKP